MLCHAALCCGALCCAVLCCAVLCCAVPCLAVLCLAGLGWAGLGSPAWLVLCMSQFGVPAAFSGLLVLGMSWSQAELCQAVC